jgi:PAS domain S-box-containing protein
MDNEKLKSNLIQLLSLEDSDIDFELICEQVLNAGFEVEISRAETEQDFTSFIRKKKFDIILADYMLPQFDAFKALKLCQEYCPDIPFICVSGSIGEIKAIELLKNGAVDYVLKDRMERLPFAITRALEEARIKLEHQKAHEALRVSEERLRDIIFSTADWVWEVDENGKYTYSSQRDIDLFGVAPDEIIGKTPFDFMSPEEANRVSVIFTEIIANKWPIKDLENWNIGKNGEPICLLTNGLPIIDQEGRLKGYRGVDKNITEKKYSEEAIRQSEAKLSYSQEIAKMGSWDLDMRNNKYTWSKNMYNLLGYQPFEKEMIFNDFINMVHPDDKPLIDYYTEEIMRTKAGVSFDFRFLLPDERVIWIQNNIEPVFRNEALIELHGVNIDITEKKLAEQELISEKERAEASDRLKTAFMNNISHEIRTPLNGILGFGQIIADPDFPMEEKEPFFKMLNDSSDRLLNTITSIMDISLLTSRNQKVYKKEFPVDKLITEIGEKFKNRCEEKNLKLFLEKGKIENDAKICSDENLLGKIISHLTDNAIKFTAEGAITIGYELKEKELLVYVKDTGIGISDKYKNQIFDNFMQVDNANTRRYEGSGIGLSISKKITDLLGGKIWFDSEKGKGTTFCFTIPIVCKNGK